MRCHHTRQAQAGMRVAVAGVDAAKAEAAAEGLRAAGRRALAIGMDVTREDEVAGIVQFAAGDTSGGFTGQSFLVAHG